jgi:cytochrome c oxidase subunit 3
LNLAVATVALAAGIVVWWLAVRRLTTRPWEAPGTLDGRGAAETLTASPARTGLWMFLAVATSFFTLFITAYTIRMNPHAAGGIVIGDWRPVPEPPILWVNTALLFLGSLGMEIARRAVDRGHAGRARAGMLAGGLFTLAFLAGQLLAWRQLQAAGYYAAANPANAFFYVLTALHGLHLLGGLVVWVRNALRMASPGTPAGSTGLGVELCTVYWHYLFLVWLVLFGLLLIT